jgi:hypothetical protein
MLPDEGNRRARPVGPSAGRPSCRSASRRAVQFRSLARGIGACCKTPASAESERGRAQS